MTFIETFNCNQSDIDKIQLYLYSIGFKWKSGQYDEKELRPYWKFSKYILLKDNFIYINNNDMLFKYLNDNEYKIYDIKTFVRLQKLKRIVRNIKGNI